MKIPRNWGLDSSPLDFSNNCCIQGGCFALFKFMMILMGKKNRVPDFSAFFKDLEGLFQYQRLGLTTHFSPGPLDSFYHMMPHLKCALSTPRISHTSSSWSLVLNTITTGQIVITQNSIQSSKSFLQGHKTASFTKVDKFKLKLSGMTAQAVSCTSDPELNDPSLPLTKETIGEDVSDFISDLNFQLGTQEILQ